MVCHDGLRQSSDVLHDPPLRLLDLLFEGNSQAGVGDKHRAYYSRHHPICLTYHGWAELIGPIPSVDTLATSADGKILRRTVFSKSL